MMSHTRLSLEGKNPEQTLRPAACGSARWLKRILDEGCGVQRAGITKCRVGTTQKGKQEIHPWAAHVHHEFLSCAISSHILTRSRETLPRNRNTPYTALCGLLLLPFICHLVWIAIILTLLPTMTYHANSLIQWGDYLSKKEFYHFSRHWNVTSGFY